MSKKKRTVTDTIRRAIDDSGKSRYRVCKDLGIPEAQMSRFMGETGGFSLPVLDRLCEYLGLELRPSKRKGR
jgi:hypothetical protein